MSCHARNAVARGQLRRLRAGATLTSQLGPAGRVITHREKNTPQAALPRPGSPSTRQCRHRKASSIFDPNSHPLLMWGLVLRQLSGYGIQNRLEHQAHSRSLNFRGACGLPVSARMGDKLAPRHLSLCCFPDIQGAASSSRCSAARQPRGRSTRGRSSRRWQHHGRNFLRRPTIAKAGGAPARAGPQGRCAGWHSDLLDRAAAFGPVLETAEIAHVPVAQIL